MKRTFDVQLASELIENTAMSIQDIADKLLVGRSAISLWYNKSYSKEYRKVRKINSYKQSKQGEKNPMYGKFGKDHHLYKGVIDDCKGYKLILKPEWYTGRDGSNHIYYHHAVYCSDRGLTEVPHGMAIHHLDGNPHNNDKKNLIMLSKGDHTRLHQYMRNLQNCSNVEF